MNGYAGKLLIVNLSDGTIREEPLNAEWARQFIGAGGLAARYLYEMVDADTDPLGPENPLIWMTGLLTGTRLPSGSRSAFCARSPLTGLWGEANIGGFAGVALRQAGYDGVIILGQSPTPVYLYITDQGAEIRDATPYWGLDTYETQARLSEALGGRPVRVACIGPAGENLVRYAAIFNADARAAGRTGMGAVMGSKRLKAIAVRGRGQVPLSERERFNQAARQALQAIQEDFAISVLKELGTAGGLEFFHMLGAVPARYWTLGDYEGALNLSGAAIAETIQMGTTGCWGCWVQCGREVQVTDGPFPVPRTDGPEYETVVSLGANLLIDDLKAVAYFDLLCDALGMDTISTGGAIGFAFYLYNEGIIGPDETDGLELTWGNVEAVAPLIRKIAAQEGFGTVLAQGSRAMEAHYNVPGLAVQVHGLEPGMYDPRAMSGMALVFLTSPRGACHNKSDYYMVESGHSFPEVGVWNTNDQRREVGKPLSVARHQDWRSFVDSAGACQFVNAPIPRMVEMVQAATGWEVTARDLARAGERIFTLKWLINHKLGWRREQQVFPRLWEQALDEGPTEGFVPAWEAMLRAYYEHREWDWETGRPRPEKLKALGLDAFIPDLWK